MKDHNFRMSAQHCAGAEMKSVIVAYVIDDRVVIFEEVQRLRIFPIIENSTHGQIVFAGLKTIEKKINVGMRGEIRQQLFVVVRDAT